MTKMFQIISAEIYIKTFLSIILEIHWCKLCDSKINVLQRTSQFVSIFLKILHRNKIAGCQDYRKTYKKAYLMERLRYFLSKPYFSQFD